MKTKSFRWCFAVFALVLGLAPVCALENDAARRNHLKKLRAAGRVFAELYGGKAPARISQLLDENLVDGPDDLMRPGATSVPPRAELDRRADYTFEPLSGVADLVIREKSPVAGESEILAIFKDGTIRALPAGGTRGGGSLPRNDTTPPPAPPVPMAMAGPPAQPRLTLPPLTSDAGRDSGGPRAVTTQPSTQSSGIEQPRPAPTATSSAAPLPVGVRGQQSSSEPAVAARSSAPPDVFDVLLQVARRMQAAQPQADQPQPTTQPMRTVTTPAGTITYTGQAAAEEIARDARSGQRVAAPPEVQLPPGIAKQDAGAPWDAVARLLEIDRRSGPSEPSRVSVESPQPAVTTPGGLLAHPGDEVKSRASRQFIQGRPWHSANWSKEKAAEASYVGETAARAGDYAKVIMPYTDFAGWLRAQNMEDNYADRYLESVLQCQQRLGLGAVPEVAYTHNNLGVVYTESRTFGAAESGFLQAQQIWESLTSATGMPSEDYAAMLKNFSVLREKQGRSAEAARLNALADAIAARRRSAGLP